MKEQSRNQRSSVFVCANLGWEKQNEDFREGSERNPSPTEQMPAARASADAEPSVAQVKSVCKVEVWTFCPPCLHVSHQQLPHAVTRQHSSHYKDLLQLLPHLGPQSVTVCVCVRKSEWVNFNALVPFVKRCCKNLTVLIYGFSVRWYFCFSLYPRANINQIFLFSLQPRAPADPCHIPRTSGVWFHSSMSIHMTGLSSLCRSRIYF